MSFDVVMPQLGETVAEGKILTWFKTIGDDVAEGDNLFEIETDKVTMEVQSTVVGKLSEINVEAGSVAKVGAVVARIGESSTSATPPKTAPTERAAAASRPPRSPFEEVATPIDSYGEAKGPQGLRVSPLARRLIAQNNLNIDLIANAVATRGGSKISERDVRSAMVAAQTSPGLSPHPAPPMPSVAKPVPVTQLPGSIVPLNAIRKRTGERLAQNWQTIPHVFQTIEVDFSAVDASRTAHKAAFKAETGMLLTYLPFIARATCIALKAFPQINAQFNADSLALSAEINLGIAVDLAHNGLVVPVVRNADDLSLPGLAKAMGRQIEKARSGRLTGDDFVGGTYSITNNGAFGTFFTAPIINAPQVAILSIDAIRLRPAVIETAQGAFVAPRLTGIVGQSFDHRAFDGAYSAAFLSKLKVTLEERDWTAEFA